MTQPIKRIEERTSDKSLVPVPFEYTINVGQDVAPVVIRFQEGPVDPEKGPNGVFMEDVIDVLVRRLTGFQSFPETACMQNELALQMLNAAKFELNKRATAREEAGVTGTLDQHE